MNTVQTNTIVTNDARIVKIQPTRNPDYVQLVTRSERKKENTASRSFDAQVFAAGNVGENIERLIAYTTVHVDFLEAYGIEHDPVSGEILNDDGYVTMKGLERITDNDLLPEVLPECKIWVHETFEPRKSKDGSWTQNPKINPSNQAVLCNQGKPIYLNRELTFDMTKEDVYISHDGTSPNAVTSDVSSQFGDLDA
jgi:hypothetical protein